MPRLDRYLVTQFLTLFGFFALVLVSVYWINRAVLLFEQLLQDGQTALVVFEFTLLTLPMVISLVLPVAAFAATAYGTNRLSSESELVVMQSAGLSPWRLARPALVFGLAIGVMVTILVNALVPMSRARLAERQAEVAENVSAKFLRAGAFQYPDEKVALFIRAIDSDGRLRGVFLQDGRDPDRQVIYTATQALVVAAEAGPRILMEHGMLQEMRAGAHGAQNRLMVTRFDSLTYDITGLAGGRSASGRDIREYSTAALLRADPAMLAATGVSAPLARAEGHSRLAQPLLAPVAALLGVAALMLGGFSRFGAGKKLAIAVLQLIVLQFLWTGAASVIGDAPERWPLYYLPPLAGAGMAALTLWIAGRSRRPACAPVAASGPIGDAP